MSVSWFLPAYSGPRTLFWTGGRATARRTGGRGSDNQNMPSATAATLLSAALLSHLPSINVDEHGASFDPWPVQDIELSIVLYDETP